MEDNLLVVHGVESLQSSLEAFGLLEWVEDASVVTSERRDAGGFAASTEAVTIYVQKLARPSTSSQTTEIALNLGVDFGKVIEMSQLDSLLAER